MGEHHKLDTDHQVFFYEQEFYVLSNFSAFRLRWMGNDFDTSEAAYHWEKFEDPTIRARILHAPSAHAAFKTAEILNPALVGYGHHWREHIITEAHYMLRTAVMHERQRAGRDHSGIFPTHFNERK